MKSSNTSGWEGGGILKVLGMACLLICLNCGGVAGFHGSLFDYVSFEETGEWNSAYRQTCRGRSHDDFREPRHDQYPDILRPPHESKTPVPIYTKEVLRENHSMSNLTLHIYSNPGRPKAYSLSYGFQRDKECIHGQDLDCIVQKSFGGIRALVLNAERFKQGQNLNFIKDHFLIEEPEKHVSILNGGSPNERKFYEAVFLGGYIPKALQSRGKSSHVIDGRSYPMEIYMYFVDETVPSMSLTTILVVLVQESEKDNPFIRPIVHLVNKKLYDDERRFLHNSFQQNRRELQFHNQEASIKYDIFAKHKKKSEEQLRQERFKVSARLNGDFADQLEIFEKMQALESQLLFLDEDIKNALESHYKVRKVQDGFRRRRKQSVDFPYEDDELYFICDLVVQSFGEPTIRKNSYDQMYKIYNLLPQPKSKLDLLTETEWERDDFSIFRFMVSQLSASSVKENLYPLEYLHDIIIQAESYLVENNYGTKEQIQALGNRHMMQMRNLTFHVIRHCQKHMNWIEFNRDQKYMQSINNTAKYQRIKEYRELLEERRLLNEDMYDHFFGIGTTDANSMNVHYWAWANRLIDLPDFMYTIPPEERKRTIVDSIINIVEQYYKRLDYETFLQNRNARLVELAKANNFPDEETMRAVLHHHRFGYKDFGKRGRRHYAHDSVFKDLLPYQQKRQGIVDLGNMEMSKKDSDAEVKLSPPKAIIEQAFQVSWLIPPDGGYYYYDGSSPVPPCYRAQNVIVFKKPINMSSYQIKALTRVPNAFNKNYDIVHTTPVLHDTKFRVRLRTSTSDDIRYEEVSVPVYIQPRNHLFLGHDGVHKNAVEEYEKRQRMRELAKGSVSGRVTGEWETALIFVIGVALLY